jgi:2,2-dialkylglycine decarboxylase (pyruvate)
MRTDPSPQDMDHRPSTPGPRAHWDKLDAHLLRLSATLAPTIIERAAGSYVYDSDGRAILDFTSGQMSSLLGHCHPAIVETVTRSIATLDHLFSWMMSPPVADLTAALAESVPHPLSKVALLSTGSESNEAAIRMAKLFTGGHEIVALTRSYHGATHASVAASYSIPRKGYGPLAPGNILIPAPDAYRPLFTEDGELDWRTQLDHSFTMVDQQSVGSLAACIVEPILSVGGIVELPPGYLAALKDKCHERGMLLIVDEAQTGLCRTGNWYAFQRDGVTPDILTLSKTLGAGLPLSAVITTQEIEQRCHELGFYFLTTHAFDPLAAAVGLTTLDVLRDNAMDTVARNKGERLRRGLDELRDRHQLIGDIRGRGLLQGIELVTNRVTKEPATEIGAAITRTCFELGLHLNIVHHPDSGSVFRMAPPLTTTDDELDRGLAILDRALTRAECMPHPPSRDRT